MQRRIYHWPMILWRNTGVHHGILIPCCNDAPRYTTFSCKFSTLQYIFRHRLHVLWDVIVRFCEQISTVSLQPCCIHQWTRDTLRSYGSFVWAFCTKPGVKLVAYYSICYRVLFVEIIDVTLMLEVDVCESQAISAASNLQRSYNSSDALWSNFDITESNRKDKLPLILLCRGRVHKKNGAWNDSHSSLTDYSDFYQWPIQPALYQVLPMKIWLWILMPQ